MLAANSSVLLFQLVVVIEYFQCSENIHMFTIRLLEILVQSQAPNYATLNLACLIEICFQLFFGYLSENA